MKSDALLWLLMMAVILGLASCGSAWKLKRAQKLINSAIENGAKVDSLKTVVHDTIHTTKVEKQIEIVKKIDTVKVIEKCKEIIKSASKKKVNDLQKEICPDTTLSLTDSISLEIQGKVYKVPVKVAVVSSKGALTAVLEVQEKKIPFVNQNVAVGVSSGYTFWGVVWRCLAAFIGGGLTYRVLKFFKLIP